MIVGMDGLVAFFHLQSQVCLGEFKCNGQVLCIKASSDQKEVFVFTDECKLYRIFNNQAPHFMR